MRLHLFSGKDFRTPRHRVFRVEEKRQASDVSPSVSSHRHAHDQLGLHKVHAGWPWNLHRSHKLFRAYYNVFLLHGGSDGAAIPKVPLVEEAHYHVTNGR